MPFSNANISSPNTTELPLEEDGSLHFYWMDASEEKAAPGVVFMFGKVHTFGTFWRGLPEHPVADLSFTLVGVHK